jgi:hypothetical protein
LLQALQTNFDPAAKRDNRMDCPGQIWPMAKNAAGRMLVESMADEMQSGKPT